MSWPKHLSSAFSCAVKRAAHCSSLWRRPGLLLVEKQAAGPLLLSQGHEEKREAEVARCPGPWQAPHFWFRFVLWGNSHSPGEQQVCRFAGDEEGSCVPELPRYLKCQRPLHLEFIVTARGRSCCHSWITHATCGSTRAWPFKSLPATLGIWYPWHLWQWPGPAPPHSALWVLLALSQNAVFQLWPGYQ